MLSRRRGRGPDLLVLLDDLRIEYHSDEHWAYELLLEHLRTAGHTFTVITWDRDQAVLDLEALGPVHYVEDVNRWRLATWLAAHGLRVVARRLRHARMRSWWARAGRPRSVLVLGPVRNELVHYVPPAAHVGALVGWRAPLAPTSLATTLAASDAVLAWDDAAADHCRTIDPAVDVRVAPSLWPRLRMGLDFHPPTPEAPAREAVDPTSTFVLGLGPVNWSGGVDQFISMAGRLTRAVPDRPLEFGWLGWLPEGPDLHPYRFDVERLGLTETFHWLGDRPDWYEFVQRADVVVATVRRPHLPATDPVPSFFEVETLVGTYERAGRYLRVPYTPPGEALDGLLDAVDVPVVHFDLPASTDLARGHGVSVPYPDTAALVEAVSAELDGPPATVRHTLTFLLGAAGDGPVAS